MHYFASFRYRTILPDGFQKLSARTLALGMSMWASQLSLVREDKNSPRRYDAPLLTCAPALAHSQPEVCQNNFTKGELSENCTVCQTSIFSNPISQVANVLRSFWVRNPWFGNEMGIQSFRQLSWVIVFIRIWFRVRTPWASPRRDTRAYI